MYTKKATNQKNTTADINHDKIPRPGHKVRGSKTGKPIMALLDLLGRTWALGLIWHLNEGPATFRQLQGRCEQISPSLLNTRLKELKLLSLIELNNQGYELTSQGKSLFTIIEPLGEWSNQWAIQLSNTLCSTSMQQEPKL